MADLQKYYNYLAATSGAENGEVSETVSPSDDEQQFWSYYARHVQALVLAAEKLGKPLWEGRHVSKFPAEYAIRAITEMRKCLRGTPWLRNRALNREANRFQKHEGWRGEIPALANCFENALRAMAAEQTKGSAGSPQRKLGQTRIPERHYVNKAVLELTARAISRGQFDLVYELLQPGSGNKASRGRALVAAYVERLAQRDGVRLSSAKINEQIRERAKAPPTHINAWALHADKSLRKKRPPKRRLIGPAIARCD